MHLSKLHFHSIGIVGANKLLNSDLIEVTPIEESPMLDGELTDNIQKYKAKGTNNDQAAFDIELNTTTTIEAKWFPLGNSNRVTSPDVRRGEMVVIYRFADSDKYWWNTMKNDAMLRRLETVVYAFSNNSKENILNDSTTTYYLEISTHKKLVTFHTAKNDGEPFSYDVQINTKEGYLIITDDDGNEIVLNSTDKRITLKNTNDSYVDINKKEITIHADDYTHITTTKCQVDCKQAIVNSETVDVIANKTTITSETLIKGKTTIDGEVSITKNLSVAGKTTTNGLSSTGSISGSGSVSAKTISASESVTAPNIR